MTDIIRFKPEQVLLPPTDSGIIYIKNIGSILNLKFT